MKNVFRSVEFTNQLLFKIGLPKWTSIQRYTEGKWLIPDTKHYKTCLADKTLFLKYPMFSVSDAILRHFALFRMTILMFDS